MAIEETLEEVRRALSEHVPRRLDHPTATPAAVLILVYGRSGDAHVVFTERTEQVEHHKGQISFPGGAMDEEDASLEAAALRETQEEIGVRPEDVEVIGRLDDMVTISNFKVTPYVGFLSAEEEYPFALNQHEVACVVEVPLAFMMDEGNMELEVRQHEGREVLVPAFCYNGHRIWGATARMLHQFIEILR
jgi:8-oxo-dGTP pyrophosphatase MutT (NUDIX family)